jgi:excinuclease ABC subunit B
MSYRHFSPEQALKEIKKLEQEMHKHARNLEFEEAAKVRDQIHVLRKIELGLPPDVE